MKLFEAPAIITHLTSELHKQTLAEAAAKINDEYDEAEFDGGELKKVAPDIWAIDKPLGPHTDKTKAGYWVFGLVIINEPGLVLFRENVIYDLPVGAVYALNGRRIHAALAHNGVKQGKFGFLAWDADRNSDVAELLADLPESLAAWVNGEARVDVS
jgi:hypothetical protein